MASNSRIQSYQQPLQCKECGLTLNSSESLEVHLQYHQENLMQQWAVKPGASNDEKNNNTTTKTVSGIKREFSSSNSMESSGGESQKRSPDYQSTTPEGMFGHPPTPQSYHSSTSPYQNNENNAYSPNFQAYSVVKSEGGSPVSQQTAHYQNSFPNFSDPQQFFNLDASSAYSQEMHATKYMSSASHASNTLRFMPYNAYERPKAQIPTSSPTTYSSQPTPSPSPNKCDKCGLLCETSTQLIEHINLAHSNNTRMFQEGGNPYLFEQPPVHVKEEEASQSEILDLDSQKVVHPVWPDTKDDDKRSMETNNPHSVTAIINSWQPHQHHHMQQSTSMYQREQMFSGLQNIPAAEGKMFSADSKAFQPHQMGPGYIANGGTSSPSADVPPSANQQPFRQYEHLQTPPAPVMTSPQMQQVSTTNAVPPAASSSGRSTNWKSNEARRPKTYNCTACNKWFTSSGHLKRHYNTTLHKNAVKSSGLPDPATQPISAHHHPARDSTSSKDDRNRNSGSSPEDLREDSNPMTPQYDNRLGSSMPMMQNMHHAPPMHSPSPLGGGHMMQNSSFPSLGGSPNGDPASTDSRGLLSMAPPPHHSFSMMSQPPVMEASSFQMYPNEQAPHDSPATDSSSLNITGEFVVQDESQPLPSFEHLNNRFHRGYANVGGLESVTAPVYTYFTTDNFGLNASNGVVTQVSIVTPNAADQMLHHHDATMESPERHITHVPQYSPTNNNNEIKFDSFHATMPSTQTMQHRYMIPASSEALQRSLSNVPKAEEDLQKDSRPAASSPVVSSTTVPLPEDTKTTCFECGKTFNRPCYLTQHIKTCHDGDKPFKCPRCGKKFGTEDVYNTHIQKHSGKKPYKCHSCPKMFNHKTDLRRHVCCHTGEKPFACDICDKGFIRKDHMIKHKETHTKKREKLSAMKAGCRNRKELAKEFPQELAGESSSHLHS